MCDERGRGSRIPSIERKRENEKEREGSLCLSSDSQRLTAIEGALDEPSKGRERTRVRQHTSCRCSGFNDLCSLSV